MRRWTRVSVRRARQDDADAIADVFLASFAATYRFPLAHSDEQVRRWIPEVLLPTEEVWVVTDPDEAVVATGSRDIGRDAGSMAALQPCVNE
jgi:hypothetical protein